MITQSLASITLKNFKTLLSKCSSLPPSSLCAFAAAAPLTPSAVKTAVSPDGYTYIVETEPYVEDTFTRSDGLNVTVLVHPAFKRSIDMDAAGQSVNTGALAKRLEWNDGAQYADSCLASSYIKKTSGASPLVSDCASIRDYYAQHHGRFVASWGDRFFNRGYCRLVITNTCVFGVKSVSTYNVNVGSRDISDLTRDSINKFQGNKRVGAEGHMICNGFQPTSVDWAIFTN
ncbi:putative necrosis-inducing factor-domain-containing protein [Neurospora tetraspora]|uniref:Necrosis-inducing factor-domain-containing protein n=1 Tax=Neurospora tetraspora TaxID=94610 RepID=A0AAE0MPQ7_9PEZI|nr:putative necrosis-inducing factor-domain-containing protein [Neurospora tetraspora]